MAKSLLRSTSIVSFMTMLSRVLGFIRDMTVAHYFGAGAGADAFYVAFKIPNFMRRLFAEGAFSQAFVPVLSEFKANKTPGEVKTFVEHMAGTLGSVLFVFTLICMLASPWIVTIFAPGFDHDATRFQMATDMLRITFPYLMLISLTAFVGAVLNTFNIFGPPAFTPVLLNLSMIGAAIYLRPHMHIPVEALAWGVFIAGIVQLCFLTPFLKIVKLLPRPRLGFHDKGVRQVLRLMLPALFGVSVAQINLLLDTVFASFLQVGSVSWLYYSDRLMNFPLGVFGVALATVVMPTLSRKHAEKSPQEFSRTLGWSMRCVLLIGIPAAIGLVLLAGPLLATLFRYGAFHNRDVWMARESLMAFAVGVPGFMLIKVLVAGYYSRQDVKTPVKIGVVAMLTNMVLNAAFIVPLHHGGIALATAIAAYVNAGLLYKGLRKRKIFHLEKTWRIQAMRMLVANAAMLITIVLLTPGLQLWLNHHWEWRCEHLVISVIPAMIVYVACLWMSGLRMRDLRGA